MPFIGDRVRANLTNEYVGGPDHKAFALTNLGVPGFVVGQPSDEAARNAALDLCQKRSDHAAGGGGRRCELYAVGNSVVYQHGRPPMPPQPWVRHDPSTERPFASKDVPLVRDPGKARLEAMFVPGRKSRSIALGPAVSSSSTATANPSTNRCAGRWSSCGVIAGVPCMIVAADDNFVVPVPTIMKATGFFHPAANASIVVEARDDVARKVDDATTGWNAVAVGTQGRPGLGLKGASEQGAVNDALGNCAKRDTDCHVIAIGLFTVGAERSPPSPRSSRGVARPGQEVKLTPQTSRTAAPLRDRRRAERHDQIGDAIEPLPAPGVELRRLAVALRQGIDLAVVAGEAQREPFLALAANSAEPVRRAVIGREVVNEPIGLAEIAGALDAGLFPEFAHRRRCADPRPHRRRPAASATRAQGK